MRIANDNVVQALRKALADEQASKILACTTGRAKAVADIIRERDIPHTTAYRMVNEMKDAGLLVVERLALSPDGKKYALYRGVFRDITVRFDGKSVETDATPDENVVVDRALQIFYSLPEEKLPEEGPREKGHKEAEER